MMDDSVMLFSTHNAEESFSKVDRSDRAGARGQIKLKNVAALQGEVKGLFVATGWFYRYSVTRQMLYS